MRRIFVTILIASLLPLVAFLMSANVAQAGACTYTVSPPTPKSKEAFTITFPGYTSSDARVSYGISIDTVATGNTNAAPLTNSGSNGVATISGGLIGPASYTFHLRGN